MVYPAYTPYDAPHVGLADTSATLPGAAQERDRGHGGRWPLASVWTPMAPSSLRLVLRFRNSMPSQAAVPVRSWQIE